MNKVENLKIWEKSMDLVIQVYDLASNLPVDEKYGLSSQIKRCAVSIPSNIAEGAGRNSNKEFAYFLNISNGSSYELQTQLLLASNLNLVPSNKVKPLIDMIIEIQKMNYNFQKKLR